MSTISGVGSLALTLEARQRSFGLCARCFCGATPSDPLQLHHVIPRRKGGVDHADNLVLLCGKCHTEWHAHGQGRVSFDDFMREITSIPTNSTTLSDSLFRSVVKELKSRDWRYEERGIKITCRINKHYCPMRGTDRCHYNRRTGKCDRTKNSPDV